VVGSLGGATRVEAPRLLRAGKVRDVYDLGEYLLMVASDRISAFDVILPTQVPGKGAILTQLSNHWFARLAGIVPNHLTGIAPSTVAEVAGLNDLDARAVVVRRAERIDIECVVRGYLAGSAWGAYRRDPVLFGHELPKGLSQASQLPEPIFTPAIKADTGHDITVTVAELADRIGSELSERLEHVSVELYDAARATAERSGIIIADTKFEFGWVDGELTLIDEALTPDSSRFWDAARYAPETDPPSFDKQFVRDWLEGTGWDKRPPGPELPSKVIDGTLSRYREAFLRLTGTTIDEWLAGRAG